MAKAKSIFNIIEGWFNKHIFLDNIYSQFGKAEIAHLPIIHIYPNILSDRIKEISLVYSDNFFFTKVYGENSSFLKDVIYSFGVKYPKKYLYIFTDNQDIHKDDIPYYAKIINVSENINDIYRAISKLKKEIKPEPKKNILYDLSQRYEKSIICNRSPRKSRLDNLLEIICKIHEHLK